MRILLISDVHANRAALDAIREPFDACLCLGDIVEYGPEPAACIEWVRTHARAAVRGNHDHGCVQNVDIVGKGGFRYLTMATRRPTFDSLSQTDRRFLAELPVTRMITLGGLRFLLVHATPRDPLDEYTPSDAKAWEAKLSGIRADFVCVGHTHQQFVLPVGRTTVVNPGSVGLPREGDPRAHYAIIENGQVELKQVEYAINETLSRLALSGYPDKARNMLESVYKYGKCVSANGMSNGVHTHGFNIEIDDDEP